MRNPHGRRTFKRFNPRDIANLECWVKTDAISAGNNDTILNWSDLTTNRNDLIQNAPSLRPIFAAGTGTNTMFGRATLYYDGARYQGFANNPAWMSAFTAATVFLVQKLDNDPPGAASLTGIWYMSGDSGLNSHCPFTDGVIYDSFGTTVRKMTVNPTPSMTSPRIYTVITAASDWRNYLDGVLLFSTGTNTVGWYNVDPTLGQSKDSGFRATAHYGEFLVYSRALDEYDRTRITNYLKNRWGIA
jgi:hypothetical protein